MNRILDLQKLEADMGDDAERIAAASTSSDNNCNCSTSSQSACPVCPIVIDI
jgi:hypothetical protein